MKRKLQKKMWIALLCSVSLGLTGLPLAHASALPNHASHDQSPHLKQAAITKEQAKEIALKQVKGRVLHVDLDTDNGILKYEVIIMTDQNEVYEVEINANTGQVIKVEKEND